MDINDIQTQELFKQYMEKHFSSTKIKELVEEFSFSELRKLMGELDIEFFGRYYLGRYLDKPFCDFHQDLIKNVREIITKYSVSTPQEIDKFRSEKVGEKLLTIAPRGHGKSKISNVLLSLWLLLYGKSPFILLVSANQALAEEFLECIKDEIEFNNKILEDFSLMKGKVWNAGEIQLVNNTYLVAKGIRSKFRGISRGSWRVATLILDDLESDQQARSEIQTEEIKEIFKKSVLSVGDKYTDIFYLGTIISENTMIYEMHKFWTGWKKLFYKAVLSFSDSHLWETWEKIYTDLSNPNNVVDADKFFNENKAEMLAGTQVLWEEKNDYYYLMKKKVDEGDIAFYSELQNDPRSSDEFIFKDIKYWSTLPDFHELEIVMYIDPAIKAGKRSDYSAITILGRHRQTLQMYVIDGSIHKLLPDDLFQVVVEKLKNYPVQKIGFEIIQAQSYMLTKLEQQLVGNNIYTPVEGVNSKGQKFERILSLEPDVKNGYILFCDSNIQYNNQIKDYNKFAKFDDAADSLAAAVKLIEGVKSIKFFDRSLLF